MSNEEVRFAALSVLRGARQGLYYGTKIRLPHSIVMTLLFNSNFNGVEGIKSMLDRMTGLTWEHSRNLAIFVALYKACLAIGRLIRLKLGDKITAKIGTPTAQVDALLAGALIGHFVWGRYSSVNSQIVMYLTSRVLMGLFKVASLKGYPIAKDYDFATVYPVWASVIWGLVMWLFEYYPKELQASLTDSMEFLYHDSNSWAGGISDFFSPFTAAVFVYVTLRARELAMAPPKAPASKKN